MKCQTFITHMSFRSFCWRIFSKILLHHLPKGVISEWASIKPFSFRYLSYDFVINLLSQLLICYLGRSSHLFTVIGKTHPPDLVTSIKSHFLLPPFRDLDLGLVSRWLNYIPSP